MVLKLDRTLQSEFPSERAIIVELLDDGRYVVLECGALEEMQV